MHQLEPGNPANLQPLRETSEATPSVFRSLTDHPPLHLVHQLTSIGLHGKEGDDQQHRQTNQRALLTAPHTSTPAPLLPPVLTPTVTLHHTCTSPSALATGHSAGLGDNSVNLTGVQDPKASSVQKVRVNLPHTPPYSRPLSYPPPSLSLVPPRSHGTHTGQPELITRDDSKCEKINQIIHFHSGPLMLPDPSHECQLSTVINQRLNIRGHSVCNPPHTDDPDNQQEPGIPDRPAFSSGSIQTGSRMSVCDTN